MELHRLISLQGKNRKAKRVGRGVGSGKGSHTTGKGQKGQKSRTGANIPVGFEGGQVPLYKKMPKRKGFVNSHRNDQVVVNIEVLNRFKDGEKVTPQKLVDEGLVKKLPQAGIKILGNGKLSKKVELEGFTYSESASKKLTEAGVKAL